MSTYNAVERDVIDSRPLRLVADEGLGKGHLKTLTSSLPDFNGHMFCTFLYRMYSGQLDLIKLLQKNNELSPSCIGHFKTYWNK